MRCERGDDKHWRFHGAGGSFQRTAVVCMTCGMTKEILTYDGPGETYEDSTWLRLVDECANRGENTQGDGI